MTHQALNKYNIALPTATRALEEKELSQAHYLDILFENRNKGYGAYYLRRQYATHVLAGFLAALGVLLFVLFWPQIRDLFSVNARTGPIEKIVYVENLDPPPAGALTLEYMKPIEAPEPVNVPPVIVKEEVPEKEEPEKPEKETPDPVTQVDTGRGEAPPGSMTGESKEGKVHYVVEELPRFPNGFLGEYLQKNIKYPEDDLMMNRQGKVYVTFIVNTDGSLSDIKVTKGVTPTMDAEALRVIENMPKWIPGKQKGEPVRVYVKLPITFTLKRR